MSMNAIHLMLQPDDNSGEYTKKYNDKYYK